MPYKGIVGFFGSEGDDALVDIVGYLRFSHPAKSDVQIQKGLAADDFLQRIWNPRTMETRFYCFENFVVPSLKAQTDKNFSLCILASPRMPKPFRLRLEAAVRDVPQVDIYWTDGAESDPVHTLFETWYSENSSPKPGKTLHFRIDDDDAFACDLIAVMRDAARRMKVGEALTFSNGLIGANTPDGPILVPMYKPFHGIGLGFLKDRLDPKCSPFRGPPHSRLGLHQDAIVLSASPAWIYIYHPVSDTVGFQTKRLSKSQKSSFVVPLERQLENLERRFPWATYPELLKSIASIPPADK